jgi:mannitol-1-phosphate/altronate dehydrogenase
VSAGEWSEAQLVQFWLANMALWGRDLNNVAGLAAAVTAAVRRIGREGMRQALA